MAADLMRGRAEYWWKGRVWRGSLQERKGAAEAHQDLPRPPSAALGLGTSIGSCFVY